MSVGFPLRFIASKTVTTAGTRVQIIDEDTPLYGAVITTDDGNAGAVYVGDSLVSSTRYAFKLPVNTNLEITMSGPGIGFQFELSSVWIDASVDGQQVHVWAIG